MDTSFRIQGKERLLEETQITMASPIEQSRAIEKVHLTQEERDRVLASEMQREENEIAEATVLKEINRADMNRCGRSEAATHFVAAMRKKATGPHVHHHHHDIAHEAQDIFAQEKKMRQERMHRALRSVHGYL